jgi:hypothetical protein
MSIREFFFHLTRGRVQWRRRWPLAFMLYLYPHESRGIPLAVERLPNYQ